MCKSICNVCRKFNIFIELITAILNNKKKTEKQNQFYNIYLTFNYIIIIIIYMKNRKDRYEAWKINKWNNRIQVMGFKLDKNGRAN